MGTHRPHLPHPWNKLVPAVPQSKSPAPAKTIKQALLNSENAISLIIYKTSIVKLPLQLVICFERDHVRRNEAKTTIGQLKWQFKTTPPQPSLLSLPSSDPLPHPLPLPPLFNDGAFWLELEFIGDLGAGEEQFHFSFFSVYDCASNNDSLHSTIVYHIQQSLKSTSGERFPYNGTNRCDLRNRSR